MLLTHFSFIWVLQMLIGYSTFLINIYRGILIFQLGIFVNVKTLLNYQLIHFMSYCCFKHNILLKIDFVLSDNIE